MTVLIVSLSPSLDQFLWVDSIRPGSIHRPSGVMRVTGGKGASLARALVSVAPELPIVLSACVGGSTGDEFDFDTPGFTTATSPCATTTRMCTVIVEQDPPRLTQFYEPINPVTDAEWERWCLQIEIIVAEYSPDATVISGRIPPGGSSERWRLERLWNVTGPAPKYVDCAGAALAGAITLEPSVVKINDVEASELVGYPIDGVESAASAARDIAEGTSIAAIVTLGPNGAVAYADSQLLRVEPGPVRPYPVGSGDAFLAGVVASRLRGEAWPLALEHAGAAGSAAASVADPWGLRREDIDREVAAVREIAPG